LPDGAASSHHLQRISDTTMLSSYDARMRKAYADILRRKDEAPNTRRGNHSRGVYCIERAGSLRRRYCRSVRSAWPQRAR
jgi:hypothetical protein